MKKQLASKTAFFHIGLILLVAVVLTGCEGLGGNTQTTFYLSDLQGLWLQENDPTEHYVRFTADASDENGYLIGREWNEYNGDEEYAVYESDLLSQYARDGFWGNGWFKYMLETQGNLTEIHLMDNGGAEIPKTYIVSVLNGTRLEYYEKDHKAIKYYFSKVVEAR